MITEEITGSHTRGNLKEVETRGAYTLVIVGHELRKRTDQIMIANVHPLVTILVAIVPTQLLAYFATLYNVDSMLTNQET